MAFLQKKKGCTANWLVLAKIVNLASHLVFRLNKMNARFLVKSNVLAAWTDMTLLLRNSLKPTKIILK